MWYTPSGARGNADLLGSGIQARRERFRMLTTQDATTASAPAPSLARRLGRRRSDRPMVAVVGAGFSGTVAAIHLRRALPQDHVVCLFDRTGRFARGPAYAASKLPYLLNVRAANMSALPDDPGHFERWLARQAARWPDEVHATDAGVFATRRLYGRYLRALLYEEMMSSGGRVRLCADSISGLGRGAGGWRVRLASGSCVEAAAVVLAIGNLPSRCPSDGVVFHDPWDPRAIADLRPDEPVLIIGTGLTMMDLVLGMRARGFGGPIIALSRRGLVPQRHGPAEPPAPYAPFENAGQQSLVALVRMVRRHVATVTGQGGTWRSAMDGLRPVTGRLWQGLDRQQRERFLRHLRPFWDVHRHRLAPGAADAFDASVANGSLHLKRGRVAGIDVQAAPNGLVAHVGVRDRFAPAPDPMVVQRVIHATGISAGAADDGLVADLLAAGQARQDMLGLGLDVTDELRVLDGNGEAHGDLWALGPVVRGVMWECTAVPDIRVQARLLATGLAHSLAGRHAAALPHCQAGETSGPLACS